MSGSAGNIAAGRIARAADVLAALEQKIDAQGGDASGLSLDATSSVAGPSASVKIKALVADYFAIRAQGAALDGQTDDAPAVNALIAQQIAAAGTNPSYVRVVIQLPPGVDLFLASPIVTQGFWTSIRGYSMATNRIIMKSGGVGCIVHGSPSSPAKGALDIQNVSFWDGNIAGSGVAAVQAYFDWQTLEPWTTSVMTNVLFRSFTQATNMTNVARDALWDNVVSYGPDNTISSLAAFGFYGTADNTFGVFTGVYKACRTVNHIFSFDFHSLCQLEGQRFYSCTSYSGWGFLRAWMTPTPAALPGVSNYQSPIWYATDCDWQGLGFAFDVQSIRNVIVRGGFYIANELSSGTSIITGPNGQSRNHRSYMSFIGCGDVELDKVEFDGGGYMESTATLVYVDKTTSKFNARNSKILVPDSIAGAWEYESGGANNRCAALGTHWGEWGGAATVLDPDGTQVDQEAVFYPNSNLYIGSVDDNGLYTLRLKFLSQQADANNRIALTIPTRPSSMGGGPIFNGGQPEGLSVALLNGTAGAAAPAWTLFDVSNTNVTIELAGTSSSYQCDVWLIIPGF